ncbi:FtsK/SpoIIIE domain-containing protein [Nocardioides jishulii]|uniref:Cell division protein FtsK n=1 Tax=Nocardioides jishulii TaxID=2575440 RepID=A0A4U2YTE9_9ACTN|nr:FtsK/SpoIIIE domain-containing protein [Nocardioides jishulii]QCX28301.1 cell division protein FtsK [Nocardioides jishulii]TKI64806.1 cell division protein FtsK [Nocardioides jishulii]
MRLSLTLVDGRNDRSVDALVDGDLAAPVADLVPALLALLGEKMHPEFAARVAVWVDGRRVDSATPAGEAGVRPGAVVALYEATDRIARSVPQGVAELRVVSGPGAGRVHRLPLGSSTIGCGGPDWSLPDLRLPPDALTLEVTPDGGVTVRAADGVAAKLEDEEVEATETREWPVGAYLFVGDTVLARTELGEGLAEVTVNPSEAVVDYNRPPRIAPPPRERTFHMPPEPTQHRGRPFPWVMVLAPAVMAVPMALILDNMRYLLFGLMSPLLAMANYISDKITNRKEYEENVREYEEKKENLLARVEKARLLEREERRVALPDPATLLAQAIGPGERLWERRPEDADHLRLRVGLTDMEPEVTIEEERRDKSLEPPEVDPLIGVPTWLGLAQLGVIGVAGEPESAVPMAQWLLGQVALLHSPKDVRIVALSDPEGHTDWEWLRWLPHLRDEADGVGISIGARQESVGRRLNELLQVIEAREAARGESRLGQDHVVLLDGARRLRTLPAVVELLRRGPKVGVRVICLDEQVRQLPAECKAILSLHMGRLTIHETSAEDTTDVVPDLVEPGWCETVARCLAPLRDTTPSEESAGLPSSSRLLEEIDLDPPTPEGIAQRWRGSPTTDVILGAGYDGPFRLDLRRDGPHALVAGTTGSGKSELLQTLVASLAVANRPDDMTFVLVDYKGGSAFKDCAKLPHTVGMVTDLDTHLVGRALVSLAAELHRREHLLAGPGAKDLEDYWALRRKQPELPSIPRLVLVIDEFASMVAELPDFITGLVSIAQRGRSLGIHLVLATQRPSGVVTPDIKANTNLRISLRVTDQNDSSDIIDAPDAALIGKNQPGRAFVRTGASTLMPFQSGRVGGRSPARGAVEKIAVEALAWPITWDQLGLPMPQRPKVKGEETDEADTDLSALVEAVNALNDSLGIPPSHRPWLDALPTAITLADLPDVPHLQGHLPPPAAWGLVDVPAEQAQRPDTFQLGRSGSLYVIGGPRSGRSTALRTLAGALADKVPVSDLNIYGLDCGNGALLGLQALAHTGAVVTRSQTSRASRLLDKITEVVEERQTTMGRAGVSDLAELRASLPAHERPPYVLLLLDRWDGFMATLGEVDGGRMAEQVQNLLRDGPAVGVYAAVSGDRTLTSGRMSSLVEDKLVLRMPDRGEYSSVGIQTKYVPDEMPDGRALTPDPVLERQVALLCDDVSGAGQNTALREIAERHRERDSDASPVQRPFSLKEMPSTADWDAEIDDLVARAADRIAAGWIPLGIGGDDLGLVGVDLSGAATALVAGPPRSGKTTSLRFVAAASRSAGLEVKAVCGTRNALAHEMGDAALVIDGSQSEDEIIDWVSTLPPGGVLVIDDSDLLRSGDVDDALDEVVGRARANGWRVVAAGDVHNLGSGYSGWVADARKSRQGLLLSPSSPSDGDLFDTRLSRSLMLSKIHPGRGLVVESSGDVTVAQVPIRG